MCWLILGCVSDGTPLIVSNNHSKYFPCTFPPHLSTEVMRTVVRHVEHHLFSALVAFRNRAPKPPSSHQSENLSHLSDNAHPDDGFTINTLKDAGAELPPLVPISEEDEEP